jgi:hypothetical protein
MLLRRWILLSAVSARQARSFSARFASTSTMSAAMPADVKRLVTELYSLPAPPQLCISVTGGGGQAIAWLLAVPGASACLLEATVPYSPVSGRQWMGGAATAPASLCSEEAAVALAREAYSRAMHLSVAEHGLTLSAAAPVLGIGCTAAVASTRPKRGEHRCHVAAYSSAGVATYSLRLAKGRRDRAGEDVVVGRLVLRAIFEAAGLQQLADFSSAALLLEPATTDSSADSSAASAVETVPVAQRTAVTDALQAVMDGVVKTAVVLPTTTADAAAAAQSQQFFADLPVPAPAIVFPGSFNPLHEGHVGLVRAAQVR